MCNQASRGPPVALETAGPSSLGAAILWREPGSSEQLRGGRRRGGGGAWRGLKLSSVPVMEAHAARLFLLLLLGAWAPAPGSGSPEAPLLVNEDVKRTVDLSSHLAKVTAEVVLAHPGGGSTARAASFLLALEPELEARLAHLGVQVSARRPRTPRRAPLGLRGVWSPGRPGRGAAASRRPARAGPAARTRQRKPAAARAALTLAAARGSRPATPRSEPPPWHWASDQ